MISALYGITIKEAILAKTENWNIRLAAGNLPGGITILLLRNQSPAVSAKMSVIKENRAKIRTHMLNTCFSRTWSPRPISKVR